MGGFYDLVLFIIAAPLQQPYIRVVGDVAPIESVTKLMAFLGGHLNRRRQPATASKLSLYN
jgi:hypothetical protein